MRSCRFGDGPDFAHRSTTRRPIAGVVTMIALLAGAGPVGAITRESTSTVVNATATRTITVAAPPQTQPGDVLIACLALNGSGVSALGAPLGWVRFADAAATFNPHVYGYYRVARSPEPASYSWTLDNAVANGAGIARYSEVDGASPLDVAAASASGRSAGSGTVAGVTTTTGNALLAGCMAVNSSKTSVTITAPSGMSQVWSLGGKRHQVAEALQPAAGATGPRSWTFNASREWAGWLAALRPAAPPAPPVNTAPPTVSGSPVAGSTLTATTGSWTGDSPITFAHQWRRCDAAGACVNVGTDASTYQLVAEDVGFRMRVDVTATNGGGSVTASSALTDSVTAPAPPQPPVNTSPPVVSGTAVEGAQLSTSDGAWSGDPPITFAHRWKRCDAAGACVDVGTDSSSYLLVAGDVGFRVRVDVTATNGGGSATASSAPTDTVTAAPVADPVITAVGDVTSSATNSNAIAVRNVVAAQNPAVHLQLGDYQYSYGSVGAILAGADRIWGPKPGGLWPIIRPTAGNTHDVTSCSESDYQAYWGRPALQGYSFDVGAWHIISLPSAAFTYRCDTAAVLAWLNSDLDAHANACTLAFWHAPYWTRPTAVHQRESAVRPWIDALYAHNADLILSSHQHDYQRFGPQSPSDQLDTARGIREFVVGTGGIGLYGFTGTAPNVEASSDTTFGALKLTLHPNGYDFEFLRAAGGSFTDSGSGTCH